MSGSSDDTIKIQLGDILNIIAPDNTNLNNKIFYVNYIDSNKVVLTTNNDPLLKYVLKFNQDQQFEDTTIEGIEILSRDDFPGYAKQNNLVPGVWVNIYFGGELPFIIIGRITDLEEDLIEIKTDLGTHFVAREEWTMGRYVHDKETEEINYEVSATYKQFPLRLGWAVTIHKSQGH